MKPSRAAFAALAALVALTTASACSGGGSQAQSVRTGPRTGETAPSPQPGPQYVALVDAVVRHGGRVWVEADLVKAWRAGTERYDAAVAMVAALAARPGVDGVKVADELGYHDGMDGKAALAFLAQTTALLHERLPGRKVMVDVVVPELGCLSWAGTRLDAPAAARSAMKACADRESSTNPGASLEAVDSYVRSGGLDVLDLSAGLRNQAWYARWGMTRDTAMAAVWGEATRRWGGSLRLQARKALAHPDRYTGSRDDAERDVRTFVDIPLEHGAQAVDVWTWSQPYSGTTYRLTDPDLGTNALIDALAARRHKGVNLWTHMTPSSLQRGLEEDVAAATRTFGTILVASGTG